MSEKVTIQDIIELLAEKHGMTKKDAETFVKGMFELIEEALAAEKYVKVKGLGTFKLTEVDSRESVNVNTGERIEIQGHTKISFTPDAGMKDLINKPFAHFETVVLNEHTHLEDTETEMETEGEDEDSFDENVSKLPEENVVVEEPAVAERPVVVEEPAVVEEPVPPVETTEEEIRIIEPGEKSEDIFIEAEKDIVVETAVPQTVPPLLEATASEEVIASEETIPSEETISSEEVIASEETIPSEEAIPSKATTPSEKAELPPAISNVEKEREIAETMEVQETSREKKNKVPWRIILAVILIVCMVGGIYWYLQSDKTPELQSPATIKSTPKQAEEEIPAIPVNDSLMQDKDTANTVTNVPAKVAKETLADTVEYDITGTKAHYTLREGESLVKLAVKFYGTKRLWPYIVKHNKNIIQDADRVPIGTILRIPELTPKK